jgi:hypothetical protein
MTLWQLPSTLVQIKCLREGNYLEDMTYLSFNGVCVCLDCKIINTIVATLLWGNVRMKLTLPKWGLGNLPKLPKLQSSIARGQKPCIRVVFISSERYQSVDVENGLHEPFGHQQHKLWQKETLGIDLTPVRVGGVWHTVEMLLRRAKTLLETSSQSEVWVKSYALANFWESKPKQF